MRILHLSDSHVLEPDGSAGDQPDSFAAAITALNGQSPADALAAVVAHGLTLGPDVVVHTGDLVDHADDDSYALAGSLLAPIDVPLLVAPGNHDDADQLADHLGPAVAAPIHHHDADGWRIVVVDSTVPGAVHGDVDDGLVAEIDARVTTADRPVVLALHHPPLSPCGSPGCQLLGAGGLLELVDDNPNVRLVLSGHLHVADAIDRRGVQYLLGPSTCFQLRHRHPLPENNQVPSPIGARVVDLDADGVVGSQLVWL